MNSAQKPAELRKASFSDCSSVTLMERSGILDR